MKYDQESNLIQLLQKLFIPCAIAGISSSLINADPANAAIFIVGGKQYDITSFAGSYNSATSNFNTPGNGGAMPWWGNANLAQQFAAAVGASLGAVDNSGSSPYFAHSTTLGLIDVYSFYPTLSPNVRSNQTDANLGGSLLPGSYYAQAVELSPPSPAAAPGPLPVLGAAVAFGMSRRLRRRIVSHPYKL